MRFHSTNSPTLTATFREAVLGGLAPDRGLYMPESIPGLPPSFFAALPLLSINEIALAVAELFIDDFDSQVLKKIVDEAFTFDAPLRELSDGTNILELFCGPTLAFKDFGARFMAGVLTYLASQSNKRITILVATSGDTGGAVGDAFAGKEGVEVVILYPKDKVTRIQELQLTTLGSNVSALQIEGTFDDCQRLVKDAFLDKEITAQYSLASANSINLARLIPQSVYYLRAFAQLRDRSLPLIFSVPSGNLGNLSAGVMAAKMGLPVSRFIAATNANDILTKFLSSGMYNAKPSLETLSSAMDVGNPSNFVRLQKILGESALEMSTLISSYSCSDRETLETIEEVNKTQNYLFDPHTAVGYRALQRYLKEKNLSARTTNSVILSTAHPAKFNEVLAQVNLQAKLPEVLSALGNKQERKTGLGNGFAELKEWLLTRK